MKDLVSELSNDVQTEYHITVEEAYKAAMKQSFNIFIIGIGLGEDDIGFQFVKKLGRTKKYGMAFVIFVADIVDERMEELVLGVTA